MLATAPRNACCFEMLRAGSRGSLLTLLVVVVVLCASIHTIDTQHTWSDRRREKTTEAFRNTQEANPPHRTSSIPSSIPTECSCRVHRSISYTFTREIVDTLRTYNGCLLCGLSLTYICRREQEQQQQQQQAAASSGRSMYVLRYGIAGAL